MNNLPQNPVMLLSYVNTQLRDNYASLDEFCSSLDVSRADLEAKLSAAGFDYMPEINQFR
ncbi:MAG: DUF4250 domain-containing protein [Bacteroidales bacterium]|jgi:biotin operon repressor|nr:DUF4250 domain-containing protein [Bacteroidales bacterium]MBP5420749.1 DUF4250 domain-containing protein [Bacteroidales bacterium]MCR5697199.1 DUF4250 domain-containing protein [Marinilabiliaceae bacterium]